MSTTPPDGAQVLISQPQNRIECTRLREHSDRDFDICRRLDWRFLLPNPELRNVAYLGPQGSPLHVALSRFSASLFTVPVPTALQAEKCGIADLVVVAAPSWNVFRSAHHALRPGGLLYAEFQRPTGVGSIGMSVPGRGLEHDLRLVRYAGFETDGVYWHRPDFEACIEMIPLHCRPALDYALSRPGGNVRRKLRLAVARQMHRLGLLPRFIPCFSVLASKPA